MPAKKPKPHWIRRTHLFSRDEYECSACGKRFRKPAPVCPACGARMGPARSTQDWADEASELEWMLDDD